MRSDPIAKKLRALIKSHRSQKSPAKIANLQAMVGNDTLWDLLARSALWLADKDTAVGRAFAAFGLDDEDPYDWRALVGLLASVLFPEPKQSGRPKQWNWERYCELLDAVDMKKRKNAKVSDEKACELLAADEQSPVYFRKSGAMGLRKALQKARYCPSPFVPTLKIPNSAWFALADAEDGVIGLDQYEALAKKIAADPKGYEALLLARFRKWKKRSS